MDYSVTNEQVSLFCEKVLENRPELDLNGTFSETVGKEYAYNSLVFCLIDAVYSIGVKYASVENTVENYAHYYNLKRFAPDVRDTYTIKDFLANYNALDTEDANRAVFMAENVFKNKQRTSSRSGILKSDACYQVAKVLNNMGINTLNEFQNLTPNEIETIDERIKEVKGQSSGIMFSYFCMLAGSDDLCKPDRWIKRFLIDNGLESLENNNEAIQKLFREACEKLKCDYPKLTVKYLDYQIWKYQKTKERNQ